MWIVKELRETANVFEVLKLMKEGWLLNQTASQGDRYKFLMIRV
ncbi:hypothetical protein NYE59_23340 [Paenibacillus sp. FSL L8-0323]